MGVKTVNRKYKNQYHQPAVTTDWLIGNTGDWERLEIDVEVSIDFSASQTDSISVDSINDIFKLNNGKSWSDYGFDIGDNVTMTYEVWIDSNNDGNFTKTYQTKTFNILNLYGSSIETDLNVGLFDPYTMLPSDRGNNKILNVRFVANKEPEGLHFIYSHITNANYQNDNLSSFIDGSTAQFSYAGLNLLALNTPAQMNPDGIQSGMAIDSCDVTKLSNGNLTTPYTYRIGVVFMLASFFEDTTNLPNRTAPSILFNAGSLTDNFKIKMFPEWNNPNTVIQNNLDHTERLGNTGWFDENFNGLDNNFIIDSLIYKDDAGNVINQLDYTKPTNVEIIVSGVPNLTPSSEFGFGFAWIPEDEADFHNKTTPFHKNLYINTGRKYTNGLNDSFNLNESTGATVLQGDTATSSQMDVQPTDLSTFFDSTGATKTRLRARFIPNANFSAEFGAKSDDDRNYIIWVSVADYNLPVNFSDRVNLLVDYDEMIKEIPPSGPFKPMSTKFIEHPEDENVDGVIKYVGFVEDDVLARVKFVVDKTKNMVFDSMTFGYEVENINTGDVHQLERRVVNLSVFPPDIFGVQQFNVNQIRGFKMELGNNKNWVKIKRNTACDGGNNSAYIAYFATKFRWEDWIPGNNVPNEYFDTTKDNNGKHNDWIDYLRAGITNSHRINFFVFTDVYENGTLKRYKNTYEVTMNDYDENANIQKDHFYFKDSDNTPLNIGIDPITLKPLGVLLNTEPTRIEIVYTNLTGTFDINDMYAVTTIEIDKGAGEMEHRQLSSVWGSESDNILMPLTGETKLKLTQVSPTVVKASCLVDNTKLGGGNKYKITGRIGCFITP